MIKWESHAKLVLGLKLFISLRRMRYRIKVKDREVETLVNRIERGRKMGLSLLFYYLDHNSKYAT